MRRFYHIIRGLLPLVLFMLLTAFASNWHFNVDLTAEQRFTLSKSTKVLLKKIQEPLHVTIFLKGEYPSGFKKLGGAADDLLRKFRDIAGATFHYEFISPEETIPGTERTYADTLNGLGVYPINLTAQVKQGSQQQLIYPVALLEYQGKQQIVVLYKGKTRRFEDQELFSAEAMLEYAFAKGISQLLQSKKPLVGYVIGNGEPTTEQVYDLSETVLKQETNLRLINLRSQPFIDPSFSTVILVKPIEAFSEKEKLILDQYLMRGGNLMIFMDRLNAEMDSLQLINQVIAYDRQLGLTDQLFRYGVRVNPDLLMDLQCDYLPFDVNGNGQFELLHWNYFPLLESANNHPINKNLGFVAGKFVNTIDTVGADPSIKKTVLLWSSNNSRSIGTPALISGTENSILKQHEKFNKSNLPAAVLLEGNFKSFFANRLTEDLADSLKQCGMPFLATAQQEGKVLVVSDGDIVMNETLKEEPIPMGMNKFTIQTPHFFPFANRDFILNSLDYFSNTDNLMESKAKDFVVRLLDMEKVQEQKLYWQLINLLLPAFLLGLMGLIFTYFRRSVYS